MDRGVAEASRVEPHPRITQLALLLAGAGAIAIILAGSLGDLAGVGGLVSIALGTVLAAPAGRGPRGGWWNVLATGAVLSAIGAVVALANEGLGGLLALLGGVAVLAGVAIGFPARQPDRTS